MQLVREDIVVAKRLRNEGGPAAVYDFLISQGSRYAVLANGVAKENTFAGISALSYMRERYYEEHGSEMPEEVLRGVKFGMALGCIDALEENIKSGLQDVSLDQAEKFHRETFRGLGLKADYWTLHVVLNTLPPEEREPYWRNTLGRAGSFTGEVMIAGETLKEMAYHGATFGDPDVLSWVVRVGGPRTVAALSNPILRESTTIVEESVDQLLTTATYFVPDEELAIFIKNNPLPKNRTKEETEAAESVRNGYAVSEATHQIRLGRGALEKTDFVSSQISSLATGGIRPGEVQIDPNTKPNEYLQQSYIDKGAACTPAERLQNSLIFNNLGANTTHNVYVDPLLLDLTGEGVKMTSIAEGVLFDIDNSGTLKRTGWSGAGTGMLVLDDGSGVVRHGGQLVSEYLGSMPGEDGRPGEVKFDDAFAALASLDSNGDGRVTAADAQWQQLRIWN